MEKAFRKHWLLMLIVLVAGFFRLHDITANPPAISWDEASIGYNAFTIATTGRDEHGKFLPLDTFAAFGDYKPPVAIYLTVPFVALFGLTELAVRLPSALFGTATVFLLYFLVRELFWTPNMKNDDMKRAELTALISSAALSITPWHIMLSRAGFEANIAFLFLVSGVLFVLKARHNPAFLYVCWLPFVLGIYTFNSTRYAGPMIALASLAWVKQTVVREKRKFVSGIIIAAIVMLPIIPHLISPESRLRFHEVSIFTDLRTVLTSNERRAVDQFDPLSAVFHNRRVGYAREYLIHFFDNLEPRYLFMKGDGNPKFSIQDVGQLLLVTAPVVAAGALFLLADYPVLSVFLLWWLFASIAPTAVARETPHALRTINALPVFMICTAYGIIRMLESVRGKRARILLSIIFGVLVIGNFSYFWHNLTSHYAKEFSGEWQYGYKAAIEYVQTVKDEYDTIVLTESIGRPYIYALFYERTPFSEFTRTKDASFDAAGFYNVYGFGKYRFTKEGVGDYKGKTLYILPPKDVPSTANIKHTIKLLNGTASLVIFE